MRRGLRRVGGTAAWSAVPPLKARDEAQAVAPARRQRVQYFLLLRIRTARLLELASSGRRERGPRPSRPRPAERRRCGGALGARRAGVATERCAPAHQAAQDG